MLKTLIYSVLITFVVIIISWFVIGPLLSLVGYSSAESSYHLHTHALLVTLILTMTFCTLTIVRKDT